jgi:hypothetical protein
VTPLTDAEVLDRHKTSLGEARDACQSLGQFADPLLVGLKGGHYAALKRSLDMLEGSCRQLGTLRADARWIRLGAVYGRARITVQIMFSGQKWADFGKMRTLFELGQRRLAELDMKTGVRSEQPILPQRASEWLHMPSLQPLLDKYGGTMH